MSRWIRAKYDEQCKENAHFTKKSVFIDSGKVQEGYWLGILKEKCPEGLGKTSENLKNNQDLVPKDFLDDKDAFLPKGAATLKYPGSDEHNDTFAKTPKRLSVKTDDVKQDVLSVVPGEQENNNGLLEYGFKTPVLPKDNASISYITTTPCLFSPELLSQATQDIISKDHELNATPYKSETISRLLEAQASSSTSQSQFASVRNSQENVQEKSPDILALMVDNRPRSSLALLSAASSDDEIDGWSDSMATPPVQWSQLQEGPKEDVEEQKKSNEKVARTLFEGQTNQDMSSEMSGFSAIESGDDQNDTLSKTLQHEDEEHCSKPDNVVELGRTSLKDSSLLKMIDEMENSPLCLSQCSDLASSASLPTERTEFSRKRSNCSCKENECNYCMDKKEIPVLEKKFEKDVEWSGDSQSFSSFLSQPTSSNMLPPSSNTTSPIAYSQEVQTLMDLVQSTPKISENMVGKKRSSIRAVKYDKNNTLGDSQTFLSRSVLLGDEDARSSTCGHDSKATRSSLVLEHDSMLCNELSTPVLHIPSASVSPLRGAEAQDVTSETHISGAANNSVSFEMPKTPTINESSSTPSSFPKGNNAQVWVSKSHLGCEANDSLNIPLAPRFPSSLFPADGSKPHRGEEAHDVSFGSISTSLEQAMVEEAEKVKTTESASDKNKGEQLSQADVHGNASKVKELNHGKKQQVTTETNPEREKKSHTTLLGVKRSSRSKRFSYPAARKPIVPKNTIECKVKKNEMEATSCNLFKRRVEKVENGRSDIMMRKVNEREKETRSMEEVGKGSEHQETLNSSLTKQQDIHRPGNKTEREGGIGYESGFHQTTCNKNKQVSVASNINPSEILDFKNTSTENPKLNLQNTSTESEDYCGEDMTDNTLISIQEGFKTSQKVPSAEMELYDMDALSQFPIELLSPIQSYSCGYSIKPAGSKEFSRMESNAKVSTAMTGFKTAGGKGVSISEEAMKKAKAVFEMENKETNENTEACKISKFKTAGGKHVSMSEEAMKKAKEIFEMENTDDDGKVGNTKLSKILGFKTDGWKDISISKKVTKKAKPVESRRGKGKVDIFKATVSGFKTAGENGAIISEQAKRKAKEIFKTRKIETDRIMKAPVMSGFKTAGGKDVSISEEGLKKAKAMFEMENRDNDGKAGNTKAPVMSGFKTAGGKDVSISEEGLKKAKAMFEMENDGKAGNTKASMMSGFKTAGGKDVSISEEAIKKAKAMFEMENDGKAGNTKASVMSGFKTAGGKDVSILEEAIKKAKAMFEMENDGKAGNTKASMMSGFKTAGGKDVSISEEAIKKAKAMFEMENDGKAGNAKAPMMSGFKTAGGKDVSISEEAVKKAKAMFEMENDGKAGNTKALMMSGFKTAGGKDVSILEEAIKKAKAMFEMENDGKAGNTKASMMSGFNRAGGKDVSISEEAVKKAKAMFEMENDGKAGNTKAPMMSGFKTAGGKDVSISEEAVKKAKAMFEMENDGKAGNTKAPMMSGFKTAGGKDVSISEEAVKKAKAMFEMENDGKASNTKAPMMSGFKTAGGKDVSISEEAIKKAKAMFENENRETNEKLDVYDLVSEKNKKNAKTESVSKERVVHFSSGKTPKGELSGTCTASVKKGNDSQSDQEVPLFKVLTPSKRSTNSVPLSDKTTVTTSSSSPTSSRCTSIVYSTPIQVVDENLSREILESSAALIADDSFTNFSECSGIHCHDERSLVPSASSKSEKTGSSDMCLSEPQLSKREALMAKARRRSASFLSEGDRTSPSLRTRSTLMPIRSSPSAILYDRRSKMFSPPLQPLVVSPNMSTPMSGFPPAKREAKRLFTKQGNSLDPATTSPTKPFPLAAEGRSTVSQRPHTTAHTGIPRRQFTTPYRSTSPLSNPTQPSHKEEGNGSPERKRPRILGPANDRRSGTKPDKLDRESVKPKMGYLFRLRQNSTRIHMKKYVDDTLPGRYTEQELRDLCVMDDVMTVTSHNAESFRFLAWRFFSKETCELNQGIRTEDEGLLFIGGDGRIGVEEIEKALSTTPGVDVKLIPHGWIANHFKWIVWKLAAMETAFPRHFAGRCLTPDWVLCQLKYRYDREVDRSHRSALKKILERDDLSSRTMVLCVSSLTARKRDKDDRHRSGAAVHEVSTVIELTDGWYSVNAVLDAPLTNLVTKGSIFEGLKLCINGAELVGSDQAVSPLEAPSSLMLRISANSTRRARWNSRLGFHSYSHPYPLPLTSLCPTGGAIGCVDVVVLRQYPVEYMEKLSNGTTVFRNSRAEEREAKRFARDLERAQEAVFTKVQQEFEEETNKSDVRSSKKARSFSPKDISKLRNPRELYDAYSSVSDPSFFEECLDNNQKKSLEDYRRTSLDNRRAELENMFQKAWDENDQNISKRTVVPMLKVRLVDYSKSNNDRTEAILSIWRPNEDVVQLLVEGSRLRIYHLMASGSRYRQGFPSLQFSTTRSTRYKNMTINHDITDHLYNQRKTTPLDELQTNPPALYSEVDLVGVIVSVTSHNSSSLQTVHISDEDHYLVSIKFWGGLKTYALDDLVKVRSLVACTNLVVRSSEDASCPTLAFNELSTLTLKPKEPYLRTALDYLNNNTQDMNMFMDIAQGSLDKIRRPDGALNMTKTRVSDRDSPVKDNTTTKSFKTEKEISPKQFDSAAGCAQPVTRDKELPTPVSRPLWGQCKRKLLENIPEPPSTPSINVSVSDSVRRDFKRPRRLTKGIAYQ